MSAQTERDAGFAALQRGDAANAIATLENASQLDPTDYLTLLYLGAAYGQAGRNDDAVTALTQAVTLQPANAQARYNLGVALERAGWKEQALTVFEQALSLQPNYPQAQEGVNRLRPAAMPMPQAPGLAQPISASPLSGAMPGLADGTTAPVASYGAPKPGFQQAPPPTSGGMYAPPRTSQQMPPAATGRPLASKTAPQANPTMGIVVGVVLMLACGIGFGFASVAMGIRIPFLTLLIGDLIGYAVVTASKDNGPLQATVAAICALGAALLGLYIMATHGVFFSPIAYIIAGFAAFRAFRRGQG